ncbi:MAG: hypothetical protein AAGD25_39120 [Cyanobacteria bacterium P01_F01_bin.150]
MESEFVRLGWEEGLIIAVQTLVWIGVLCCGLFQRAYFAIEIRRPTITLSQTSTLWTQKKTNALSDIYQIQILEKTYRDKQDSQVFFQPMLLMASGQSFILGRGLYRSNAETLAKIVQIFLQEHLEPEQAADITLLSTLSSEYVMLSSLPQLTFQDFQSDLPNCIFKGQYSQYCSTHLRCLDEYLVHSKNQKVCLKLKRIDQNLQSLDFIFLGDLTCVAHPNLYWCVYANEPSSTYALLRLSGRWPILDFYTTFEEENSITTSNQWLLWQHFKQQGIYRYGHPWSNTRKLWDYHYQHVSTMVQTRKMTPVRVEPTLMAIAQTLDDFFVRYEQCFSS